MKRVVIVGAGAMGCLFAARLAESGAEVTLVDVDDQRLAMLAWGGVTLEDDSGSRTVAVKAVRAAALSEAPDLIVMFTKGAHTRAAASSIAHLVGTDTRALTLQNGLGNAEVIAEIMPADRILIGVTDIPSDLQGPTHVSSHGAGQIWLGPFEAKDESGAAFRVADLFQAADLNAAVDPHVRVAIWEKVAFNAAMNALCTVTLLPVGGLNNGPGHRLVAATSAEAIAVATAMGVPVSKESVTAKLDHALAHHTGHKPSMLQDRLAGRPTEIETINGAVVAAGESIGVDTPVNRTLADLVRTVELSAQARP